VKPPRLARLLVAAAVAPALFLAACSSSDSTTTGSGSGSGTAPAGSDGSAPAEASGEVLRIGYSAWPGWFPLAVAENQGIFDQVGLDVELTYFVDYTASLDALVAEQIDVNSQTLNDTIFAVSSGAGQKIVVVNDNSTGNDQIICDESIKTTEDMRGKTVAAEAGVVDHFLLLQGLEEAGMTEEDIDFQGVKTDAAAAAFEGGQFDCVGVFAPFTVQALARPGSHAVFTSKDFPGVIPDHLVATEAAAGRSGDMAKLVEAWYLTLAWIEENPDEATKIMAEQAQVSVEEYEDFESGTTIFSADEAVKAFEDRPGDPTSLPEMARRINPFLVSSGLAQEEADLTGIFEPSFTIAYAETSGS
jgi:NitT/TauT family transport system substrate-binding protein